MFSYEHFLFVGEHFIPKKKWKRPSYAYLWLDSIRLPSGIVLDVHRSDTVNGRF